LDVETLRKYSDQLHQNCNLKLHGTFKGILEERIVKTNSTGRVLVLRIILC
jgi:hypothetical protein